MQANDHEWSRAEQFRARLEWDPGFVQKLKNCPDAAGIIQAVAEEPELVSFGIVTAVVFIN